MKPALFKAEGVETSLSGLAQALFKLQTGGKMEELLQDGKLGVQRDEYTELMTFILQHLDARNKS